MLVCILCVCLYLRNYSGCYHSLTITLLFLLSCYNLLINGKVGRNTRKEEILMRLQSLGLSEQVPLPPSISNNPSVGSSSFMTVPNRQQTSALHSSFVSSVRTLQEDSSFSSRRNPGIPFSPASQRSSTENRRSLLSQEAASQLTATDSSTSGDDTITSSASSAQAISTISFNPPGSITATASPRHHAGHSGMQAHSRRTATGPPISLAMGWNAHQEDTPPRLPPSRPSHISLDPIEPVNPGSGNLNTVSLSHPRRPAPPPPVITDNTTIRSNSLPPESTTTTHLSSRPAPNAPLSHRPRGVPTTSSKRRPSSIAGTDVDTISNSMTQPSDADRRVQYISQTPQRACLDSHLTPSLQGDTTDRMHAGATATSTLGSHTNNRRTPAISSQPNILMAKPRRNSLNMSSSDIVSTSTTITTTSNTSSALSIDVLVNPDGTDSTEESKLCCVCMVNVRCMVLIPCGHFVLCRECAGHPNMHVCPICRSIIRYRQLVYL